MRPDTPSPQITGGYIFKFDQAATDASAPLPTCKATTGVTCWTDCEITDPVPLPLPTEQLAWLTQYLQSFHNTLFTTPLGNYSQYIDVASFVDYLIINELTRNTDAYVRSAYFNKERDMPIKGGPLWDYNFALGVGGQAAASATPLGTSTTDGGWMFQGKTAGSLPSRNVNSWFPKLMTDAAFVTKVKARWKVAAPGGALAGAGRRAHQHAGGEAPGRRDGARLRHVARQQAVPDRQAAARAIPGLRPDRRDLGGAGQGAAHLDHRPRMTWMDSQWQ